MILLTIDYTIPLWGIIVFLISTLGPTIWGLITMYFLGKENRKEINSLKTSYDDSIKALKQELYFQETAINAFKKDIEDKLDKHKIATDVRLSNINDGIIETKTLVKLLVENRITK